MSGTRFYALTDMTGLFANCTFLRDANLEGMNAPRVTTMEEMFQNCVLLGAPLVDSGTDLGTVNVKDVNIPTGYDSDETYGKMDTGTQLRNVARMFKGCAKLTAAPEIPTNATKREYSGIDTMFEGCDGIKDKPKK